MASRRKISRMVSHGTASLKVGTSCSLTSINRFPVTETPLTPSGFNRFVATRADLRSDFQSDPEAVGKGRTLVHLPAERSTALRPTPKKGAS